MKNGNNNAQTINTMSAIEKGTIFRITGNVYKNKIFTCVDTYYGIDNGYTIKAVANDGTDYYFSRTNLAYYGDSVKIISQAKKNETSEETTAAETNLEKAFRQTYANKVALADTPEAGERWHRALTKAMTEIENNKTIIFADGVMTFQSRFSGKFRIVKETGCAPFCDCKGTSYHTALYAIVSAFTEIESLDSFTTEPIHICSFCNAATETGSDHWDCELGVADGIKAESTRLRAKETAVTV
ncbi:MAG TPA: hypothetical protein VF556_07720 [Pyrinomonadaceae bacterium]|jgi:hypothetical protein